MHNIAKNMQMKPYKNIKNFLLLLFLGFIYHVLVHYNLEKVIFEYVIRD